MTLHAASRDALAAAELRLLELVDGTSTTGTTTATAAAPRNDALTTLGGELFAVVDLLTGQTQLRRALGDSSSEPAKREQLVRGLLAGQVGEATVQVLVEVVTSKWSSPRELVDGIESLARSALLAQAERDGRLDAVEDELFRLGRIVEGNADLDRALTQPASPVESKLTLVDDLVGGKVEPVTALLVRQLVRTPRGQRVVAGLSELSALAAKRRERSVAHVRSAVELTAQQQDRLLAALTRIYSRPIALHVEVDPSLTGGVLIKVGDEVIDGSTAGRLAALRRDLAG
jgi:F-type H+-transporting ATPase subunit delta